MSEQTTPQPMTLADMIKPKSDQLNGEDLLTGPRVVRITGVKRGSAEQPFVCEIVDAVTGAASQPYKPCKTMLRVIVAAWGLNPKQFIGKRLKLFFEPSVQFGGSRVGGIRISHMSDIPGKLELLLSTSRSKRSVVSVDVLKDTDASTGGKQ